MSNDTCRWIYGFLLLIIFGGLSYAVSLGKVQKDTSYGFDLLLIAIGTQFNNFGQWAFGNKKDDK